MTVQFGVHLGPQKAPMAELRTLWRWLDSAGMDWISVWDHLYESPHEGGSQPHYEAVATLAALAADTTRARLGCLVFATPYRNVGLLAKSIVTIDHISGGRFEAGLGSGWYAEEAAAFGLPFPSLAERFDTLEAQTQVLRSWFDGEPVTWSGPGVEVADALIRPVPQGGTRLWIGGVGKKRTLKLAGALATGWNAAYVPATVFAELNQVLDDWCVAAGRSPAAVERSVNLAFNTGPSNWIPANVMAEREEAQRMQAGALTGRPEDMMAQVAPYIEAGAQLVNIVIRPPWDRDALETYVSETVTAMRAEWA